MRFAAVALAMMIYWPHPGIHSTPRIPQAVSFMSLSDRQKRRLCEKAKIKRTSVK